MKRILGSGKAGGWVFLFDYPSQRHLNFNVNILREDEQLLGRCLKAVKAEHVPIYITYAIPYKTDKPTKAQMMAERERLLAELASVNPQKIVCFGGWSYQTLTGKYSAYAHTEISQGRMEWFTLDGRDVPLLTTIPLYVLKANEDRFRDFSRDMIKLARQDEPLPQVDPPINFIRTYAEFKRFAETSYVVGTWSVDLETTGFNPLGDKILSLGFARWDNGSYVAFIMPLDTQWHDKELKAALWKWLNQGKRVFHNATFDIQFLMTYFDGDMPCQDSLEDTLLLNYANDERAISTNPSPHGLKTLSRIHYDAFHHAFDWDSFYEKLAMATADQQANTELWADYYHYLALDVIYTARLYHDLVSLTPPDVLTMYYKLLIGGTKALARMEFRGALVNRSYLYELMDETKEQIETLKMEGINLNSPKQVQAEIYRLWADWYNENDGDVESYQPSTAKAILATLAIHAEDGSLAGSALSAFCNQVIEYRETSKTMSGYIQNLLLLSEFDGRIHADFRLAGTSTGRLSCSKPNLQNQPARIGSKIRKAFYAPSSWVFLSVDYSQLELRVAAHISQDEKFMQAYQDGRDLHTEVASSIWKVPREEVNSDIRRAAKVMNFGILYGMGPQSISEQLSTFDKSWTVQKAEKLIHDFMAEYPDLAEWIDETHQFVLKNYYIETQTGRRRRWPYITNQNKAGILRQAVNTPIQSLASDFTLYALIKIHEWLIETQKRSYIIMTIHDEICLLVHESELHEVAQQVKQIMLYQTPVPMSVPLQVDVEIGPNWGELTKYKFD